MGILQTYSARNKDHPNLNIITNLFGFFSLFYHLRLAFESLLFPRCVTTKKPRLWSLTTDLECAKLDLLEMMHLELSFRQSLADQNTPELWSVWATKTPTSAMRLSLKEVSSLWCTPSSTASSLTGMTWRKSGTTLLTMS